jgi:hypothetical protein
VPPPWVKTRFDPKALPPAAASIRVAKRQRSRTMKTASEGILRGVLVRRRRDAEREGRGDFAGDLGGGE